MRYMLTADWAIEQRINKNERVNVDSGTHAGSHVPVGVRSNIADDFLHLSGLSGSRSRAIESKGCRIRHMGDQSGIFMVIRHTGNSPSITG